MKKYLSMCLELDAADDGMDGMGGLSGLYCLASSHLIS